jgi:large subunit ribosomal protein L11
MDKIKEIAQLKMGDLNTSNLDQAMKTIMGTARSMGLEIV